MTFTLPAALLAASAGVIFVLGLLHLVYTIHGPSFRPRDPGLKTRMEAVSPHISRETTMWKAWIGFNASHSLGALLFGAVYGYLALVHGELLFHSPYLCAVGLALLATYAYLGKRFWFSVPYRGILLATALYIAALVMARQQ